MLTFIIYARRTPELLGRLVSIFHGRAIDIESLVAGRTGRPDVLQIKVTVECDQDRAQLIEANLYRIVDVLFVEKNYNYSSREAAHPSADCGHCES